MTPKETPEFKLIPTKRGRIQRLPFSRVVVCTVFRASRA